MTLTRNDVITRLLERIAAEFPTNVEDLLPLDRNLTSVEDRRLAAFCDLLREIADDPTLLETRPDGPATVGERVMLECLGDTVGPYLGDAGWNAHLRASLNPTPHATGIIDLLDQIDAEQAHYIAEEDRDAAIARIIPVEETEKALGDLATVSGDDPGRLAELLEAMEGYDRAHGTGAFTPTARTAVPREVLVNPDPYRELTEVPDVRQALMGTVIDVGAKSANGDITLHFADGRVVLIDTGYVGARLYMKATE